MPVRCPESPGYEGGVRGEGARAISRVGGGGRRDGTDPIDPCTVHFSGGSVPVRRRASVPDAGPASNRHWDGTQIRRSIRLKSQLRLDPACRTLSIDLIDLAPLVFPFFHTFPVPGSHECIVLLVAVIASQYTIPVNTKHSMTFVRCRPNVEDAGPTLYKGYTNVLCCWDIVPPRTWRIISATPMSARWHHLTSTRSSGWLENVHFHLIFSHRKTTLFWRG